MRQSAEGKHDDRVDRYKKHGRQGNQTHAQHSKRASEPEYLLHIMFSALYILVLARIEVLIAVATTQISRRHKSNVTEMLSITSTLCEQLADAINTATTSPAAVVAAAADLRLLFHNCFFISSGHMNMTMHWHFSHDF